MKSHIFPPQELAVLGDTANWRFISSAFPVEVEPAPELSDDTCVGSHTHAHPHRELIIILSGNGFQRHCGKTYIIRPGTVLLFDAMEPHEALYPKGQPPAKHLWCHFLHDECGVGLMEVGGRRSAREYRTVWQQSYSLIELGLASQQALFPKADPAIPPAWTRHRCAGALELLISSLVQESYQPHAASKDEGFQDRIIKAMVSHIQEHNGRDCCLETLAHIAGYSKYHFSRLFKSHMGISLRECVNATRARALQRMLAQRVPLKSIATELGFAHASALCRWRRQMKV